MKNELLNIDNKAIGHRIRTEREALSLTREKFAEIVDFSPLYIGQLERGERQMSLIALVKISNCLHISTDYLIYGNKYTDTANALLREDLANYSVQSKNLIYDLINKCSTKELHLIEDIIKLILPYIK